MISRFILAMGLMCLGLVEANADWTRAQRNEFTNVCVQSCLKNEKVTASEKKYCPIYCQCFVADTENLFSDYDKLNSDIVAAADGSELKRKFLAIAPACNKQAFPD
jgi:hypothetical protein